MLLILAIIGLIKMVLKPKSNLKPGSKHKMWSSDLSSFLNSETANSFSGGVSRKVNIKVVSLITGFLFLFFIFTSVFGGKSSGSVESYKKRSYPVAHGYYTNEIQASSPLIFPHVDHATILKEIGVRGLYILRIGSNGDNRYYIKSDDKSFSDDEIKKTTDQVVLVKRSFLDHGKLVYRKNNGPEVVVVSLIDFEKYDVDTLVKIVQNRVDYAQKHDYGVYIRWIQEFLPILENQNLEEYYSYIKPLIMRAAIHAFPSAKHIIFIDQNALVMDMNISLQKHILDPKGLEMSILKNVPVTGNSNIRTYENFPVANAKVLIAQGNDHKLDMSSFVVSTCQAGKVFLEFLSEPLIRNYPWNNFEHSVAHILQWHATFLSKTALVSPKLFASKFNPETLAADDVFHYNEGDFIISLKGCEARGTCTKEINHFYDKVKKS